MARRGSAEGSVFQRKDGLWSATVELGKGAGGKRLRKTLYGRTKREVLTKLGTEQEAIRKGTTTTGDLTVGEWLDQWLASLEPTGLKASTVRNYGEVVRYFITPHLGHIRLARLTPEDVENMGRSLAAAGRSTNSQRLARTILRRSLNQAERRGYVNRNVVALTDAPHVEVAERPTLSADQAKQLLAELSGDPLHALYTVSIHTGLRQGEALTLRWSDVDFESGTIQVTGRSTGKARVRTEPKTDRSRRTVALTPQATEALRMQQVRQNLEGSAGTLDLVFTSSRGTALFDSNIRRHWQKVSSKLGLPPMHWHDLRHSAATIMLAQGVPIEVVSRVLGHASIRITADIYGHVSPEAHREATDALARALS